MRIALIKVEPGGEPYPPPLHPPFTVLHWGVPLTPNYKHDHPVFASSCYNLLKYLLGRNTHQFILTVRSSFELR